MIYLMRHGETAWNSKGRAQGIEDIPLNLAGIKQALARRETFAGHDIKVRVSPLVRAKKSAELATSAANVTEFIVDDRLIEYDFGDQTREPEDYTHFVTRIAEALSEFGPESGNVLIVSHGAVIGDLIRLFLPDEYKEMMLPLYNCSVSAIDYEDGYYKLVGVDMSEEELERLLSEHDG